MMMTCEIAIFNHTEKGNFMQYTIFKSFQDLFSIWPLQLTLRQIQDCQNVVEAR